MKQSSGKSAKTKQSGMASRLGNMSRVGLALIGVLVMSGLIFIYHAIAATGSTSGSSSGTATLSLSPASGKVSNGKTITIGVYENSQSNPVNAVQANLTYPTAKFTFVAIDPTGSAFSVPAQGIGSNGSIKIARGSFGKLTGNRLVAKIVLRANVSSGNAAVNFVSGSGIIRTTDHKDILQKTSGATYTLTN
jgi:hypothetical protein